MGTASNWTRLSARRIRRFPVDVGASVAFVGEPSFAGGDFDPKTIKAVVELHVSRTDFLDVNGDAMDRPPSICVEINEEEALALSENLLRVLRRIEEKRSTPAPPDRAKG